MVTVMIFLYEPLSSCTKRMIEHKCRSRKLNIFTKRLIFAIVTGTMTGIGLVPKDEEYRRRTPQRKTNINEQFQGMNFYQIVFCGQVFLSFPHNYSFTFSKNWAGIDMLKPPRIFAGIPSNRRTSIRKICDFKIFISSYSEFHTVSFYLTVELRKSIDIEIGVTKYLSRNNWVKWNWET